LNSDDPGANPVYVYKGKALANYGFGDDHPFGPDRHEAFQLELAGAGLGSLIEYADTRRASVDELSLFHSADYINFVSRKSEEGLGFLDCGDTPAYPGIFDAASDVAGTTLAAVDAVMSGATPRAFSPIAGLHHAGREHAAGFCVFNDCGIAIEYLRHQYGIKRVAYVDIDAHHGDGVFYSFEDDPDLLFADIHQDGRTLYPGTGSEDETGKGAAVGTKLNIPVPPFADDIVFQSVWPQIETYLKKYEPEFILLQCGADSIEGDPITNMAFSPASHAYAAKRLCALADQYCDGKFVAMGGGGYNHDNIARAWTAVVDSMVKAD